MSTIWMADFTHGSKRIYPVFHFPTMIDPVIFDSGNLNILDRSKLDEILMCGPNSDNSV